MLVFPKPKKLSYPQYFNKPLTTEVLYKQMVSTLVRNHSPCILTLVTLHGPRGLAPRSCCLSFSRNKSINRETILYFVIKTGAMRVLCGKHCNFSSCSYGSRCIQIMHFCDSTFLTDTCRTYLFVGAWWCPDCGQESCSECALSTKVVPNCNTIWMF